jgi:uncharacterized membrane protein YccC
LGGIAEGMAGPLRIRDPGQIFLRRAGRVVVLVPLMFFLFRDVLQLSEAVLPVCFATFSILAFADLGGPVRDRLIANLCLTGVGTVLVALGIFFGQWRWPSVLATIVVVFWISYATVLRGYFGAAAVAAIVPWVLAVTEGSPLSTVPVQCLGWAAGGLASTMGALLLWPSYARSAIRLRLADSFDAAAAAVQGMATAEDLNERMLDLLKVKDDLAKVYIGRQARPGGGTFRDRSLLLAVDELHRLSTILLWEASAGLRLRDEDRQLATDSARTLGECAIALRAQTAPPDPARLNQAREEHQAGAVAWAGQAMRESRRDEARQTLANAFRIRLTALTTQLIAFYVRGALNRKANGTVTLGGQPVIDPARRGTVIGSLQAQWNWRSPWFRTAIRSSVAMALTVLVVSISGAEHGFWVSLGALGALKFDASGTRRTAWQVFMGTVAGFAIGVLTIYVAGPHASVFWLLLPFVIFLAAYTPGATTLAIGQAAFTIFLIVLFGISQPGSFLTSETRLQDVLMGLSISLLVSLLIWPHGMTPLVFSSLRQACAEACALVLSAFAYIADGGSTKDIEQARQTAERAVARANETFDLAYAQSGPGLGDVRIWTIVSATATHLVYASQFLEALRRVAPLPAQAEAAKEQLVLAGIKVRSEILAAVDAIGEDPEIQDSQSVDRRIERLEPTSNPAVGRLREVLSADMAALDQTDERLGTEVVSLVYAVEWAVQLLWLADRLSAIAALTPDRDSNEARQAGPAQTQA